MLYYMARLRMLSLYDNGVGFPYYIGSFSDVVLASSVTKNNGARFFLDVAVVSRVAKTFSTPSQTQLRIESDVCDGVL